MSGFLRGLAEIHRLRDERQSSRADPVSSDLAADPLAGARFRPGDRLIDPVTGQEGLVVYSALRHVTIPTPRG